jgi:transcriptional regulator with XRE-family HTH domain
VTHPELTPDEADRLTGRLRYLLKRRRLTRPKLCGLLGISRSTLHQLENRGFMTRRTANRLCQAVGWEPDRLLLPPAARQQPTAALFTPAALQAAARHCDAATPVLRAQILLAAAANLLLNLQFRGGSAVISGADRVLNSGEIDVNTHLPDGTLRHGVRFTICGRRLVYAMAVYPPLSAPTELGGTGDATETGFGFCLEFLNQPPPKSSVDRLAALEQKIQRQLKKHEP